MTENAQHTPGPRFTRQQVRDRYRAEIEADTTRMDFESWLLDEVNALECRAAAAPDLLAACERAILWINEEKGIELTEPGGSDSGAPRFLHTALAKAKGQD